MKTCPHCGHENLDTATLCEHCHEALSAPDSAVQATSESPAEQPPDAPPEGIPVWPGAPASPGPAQQSPPPSWMSSQPQEPVPLPPPAFWTPLRLYLLGIGLGLIPLALWLVAWSAGVSFDSSSPGPGQDLSTAAVWLYLIQLVAGVICRVSRRARHVGYGLLTMVLVDPVVGTIGCVVIASRPRYAPVPQQPIPPPPLPALTPHLRK